MQCGNVRFSGVGKPGGGLSFRSVGTLRRDRHVLEVTESARCHLNVFYDAARRINEAVVKRLLDEMAR